MRLGKIATILCYGVFSQFLATSSVLASVPANKSPHPIQTDIKKPDPLAKKISKKEQVNKTMQAVSETAKHKLAKLVQAEKKVAYAAPAVVKKPEATIEQKNDIAAKAQENLVADKLPDYAKFSQTDLEQRQGELAQQIDLAKEKEAAEAEVIQQYYVAHDRELKMQKIAKALANQVPSQPADPALANQEVKAQAALKAAVMRNMMSVSQTNMNVEQHRNEFAFDAKQISKRVKQANLRPTVTKPAVQPVVAAIKAVEPAKKVETPVIAPAQQNQSIDRELVDLVSAPTTEEKAAPDYDYLPEGAQIISGNPYED
jgi:hypothetical protein